MDFVIALDQGDYLQERGGFDWGRCGKCKATCYDSASEAENAIRRLRLESFGARVEEYFG